MILLAEAADVFKETGGWQSAASCRAGDLQVKGQQFTQQHQTLNVEMCLCLQEKGRGASERCEWGGRQADARLLLMLHVHLDDVQLLPFQSQKIGSRDSGQFFFILAVFPN